MGQKRPYKKFITIALGGLVIIIALLVLAVQLFLEPALKKKIHTLIINGSDSLYTYELKSLRADFLGGNVDVEGLEISIDSNRYRQLLERNVLPALTMQVKLERGQIKGVGIISLLLGKKINIEEIVSRQADIRISRHLKEDDQDEEPETGQERVPLWKSMQPAVKGISIGKLKLDGVKLLYRNADSIGSVKLQFDRFDAEFDDIKVDSLSAADTSRIGFTKKIFLKFHDLKFRTPDSSYKLKAEWITYDSETRLIEVDSFKLQPTLPKEEFYAQTGLRKSLYYLEFDKIRLVNAPLEKYIHRNRMEADSIVIDKPQLRVYLDKSMERIFGSKMGKYPHQLLQQAPFSLFIKNILLNQASVLYTEKSGGSGEEGNLELKDMNIHISNITNRHAHFRTAPLCVARAQGKMLGGSPLALDFRFPLDSANGRFDVSGSLQQISAAQINTLSIPLANLYLPSMQVHQLEFSLRIDDYDAFSDVNMRYNNLSMDIRKRDAGTGAVSTRKFLTRVINNYAIYRNNPENGQERTARNVRHMRLTTQSFFGVIWKAIFAGMQQIMLQQGGSL